jgi:hypothetical protein
MEGDRPTIPLVEDGSSVAGAVITLLDQLPGNGVCSPTVQIEEPTT